MCRAYHLLLDNGFDASNVITMASNDVASWNLTKEQNPFPGQLFTSIGPDGEDWYEGCKFDYEGELVNPENYLSVITGDDAAEGLQGGPVLKSTKEDRVFLFFVDHGGVGMLCFPEGKMLYQDELLAALAVMTEKEMYSELLFYVEACEAGSMFQDSDGKSLIPEDSKIYVNTASNATQSSYAVFCPPFSIHDGKLITTCLADLWNTNWYNAVTKDDGLELSLSAVYEQAKNVTEDFIRGGSNPAEFGDKSFVDERNGDFLSSGNNSVRQASKNEEKAVFNNDNDNGGGGMGIVKSEDVLLNNLYYQYLMSDSEDREREMESLVAELKSRDRSDKIWKELKGIIKFDVETFEFDFDCIREVNGKFRQLVGPYDDYSQIRHSQNVVYMCSAASAQDIVTALASVAAKY